MSEPVTKQRSTVDLDAFEREMRDAGHYHRDDPLAELARLVGEEHDPYDDMFARETQAPSHTSLAHASPTYASPAYAATAHQEPDARPHDEYHSERREPGFAAAPMSPRLSGDFAAIEAGLRGSDADHTGYDGDEHAPSFDDGYDRAGHIPAAAWQEPEAPARSRRPMFVVAATIAVGVIGIGTAFALKGHVSTSPREVKTILADGSPTKVQPPAEATADAQVSGDAKSQSVPTALATREEQPVDLLQAARDNAAAQARLDGMRGRTDASSVPVPPSPGQIQSGSADAGVGQAFSVSDMPAPKRVKVVSVRPDGTILPDDKPPQAAVAAPRAAAGKTSDRTGPVAKPVTPKTATPKTVATNATTKTTSRVTTPRTIDQLTDGGDDAGAKPAATPKKPKLARVASADAGDAEATAAISPEPDAGGNGGFAVQLAAPGSEADARATSSRLAKKFAGSLGSHHLAFHKADSNGKAVYRVRVSSLSRTDAVSLCEKLKADGGSCFVAKN